MDHKQIHGEGKPVPLMFQLKKKPIVVIGGGRVATRRIRQLNTLQLPVTVISPKVTQPLLKWSESGRLVWKQKNFSPDDIKDAQLIIAATDDTSVNEEVYHSKADDQLVNIVDQPEVSDFHFPAICSRGNLLIAISTSGSSPLLSKHIKEKINTYIPHNYDRYVEFLGNCREKIKRSTLPKASQQFILKKLLDDCFVISNDGERQQLFEQLIAEESRKLYEAR